MDAMAAIKETFFQECEEQLAELESGLLAIEDGDKDPERVNAVFRAVHSVKGGAGAFQLNELAHFAHVFENALDQIRAGRLAPEPRILKTMLRAADVLADLVRAARDSSTVDESRTAGAHRRTRQAGRQFDAGPAPAPVENETEEFVFQPVQVSVEALLGEFTSETSAERVFTIRFRPKPSLYAKANETALILRELARLGTTITVCDQSDLPLLAELDPEGAYLTWTVELTTTAQESAIREIFEFVEWDCDLEIDERVAEAPIEPVTETEPLPQPTVEPREIPAKKPQAENSAPVRLAHAERRNTGRAAAAQHDPRRSRAGRSAHQSRRRTGHQSGDAGAARLGSRRRALVVGGDRPRRTGTALPRDPGKRDGHPRPAGEAGVPTDVADHSRSGRRHRQVGAPRHRGRCDGGRQDGHRMPCRSADPHDPQCRRSWH